MGFRNYMTIVPRNRIERLRNVKDFNGAIKFAVKYGQLNQSDTDDNYISVYDFFKEEPIYEFGKYIEWGEDIFNEFGQSIFKNDEINERYESDYDFFEITKEGLEKIIDGYRKSTFDYYENIRSIHTKKKNGEGISNQDKVLLDNHFNNKTNIWKENGMNPYNLFDEKISGSWEYEYAIFELVRIYKSIDREKEAIIITGY